MNVVLDDCRQEPQAAAGRPPRPSVEAMQWEFLDEVNLHEIVQWKFKVLQSCPVHLKGMCRQASRVALEALHTAVLLDDETKQSRAWNLFGVLPFWLLLRPGSQRRVGRDELVRRYNLFEEGQWEIFRAEATRVPQPVLSQRNIDSRAEGQGSLCPARQCPTGAAFTPRTQETLHEFQNRRPQV